MSKTLDIIIVGAGPGGYVAALKAATLGARVAIVEKHLLGGTCLNYGCIPSKAILASAELMHHIQHADDYGITVGGAVTGQWDKIQARKDKVVSTLRNGVKGLLSARKVTIVQGQARLADASTVVVTKEDGSTESLSAGKIILASGSVPARIPGWPADPSIVATSDEALHWKTLPKKLLIVGGGVIGCEFACMLRPFGVEVVIVEMLPRLLPNLDAQLGDALAKTFEKRGIACHTGVKIESVTLAGAGVRAALGNGQAIEADRMLVATGRKPNTADLGLDKAGLAADRGFLRVNDRMETPVKSVYCIGDANGRCLLAHAASEQGIVAVENALGHDRAYNAPIPNCVYTYPEIASVGITADEAREKNLPISIGNFPLAYLGKALAVNASEGFVKVVRHRETEEVLGIHMMGHNVTEVIAAAGALLHRKATSHDIADIVFAHPTMAESIKEATEDSMGAALHAPPRKVARIAAKMTD